MGETAWLKLQGAAQALKTGSRRVAEAGILRVGAHTSDVPGFANKAEIQALIDEDPALYKELSAQTAEQARDLRMATTAKDLRRTRDLTIGLSAACQTCQTPYLQKPAA